MEENLVTRGLGFLEKPQVRKSLKIAGIVFVALLPVWLFLLSLFVPIKWVNNLAIRLGINNLVRKYYASDLYAKAFGLVNKNRLICVKDGKEYFLGEYYFTEKNCFMCLCDGKGNFKCVSNSSNKDTFCQIQPGFIPASSEEKSDDSSSPSSIVVPTPSSSLNLSPTSPEEPKIIRPSVLHTPPPDLVK